MEKKLLIAQHANIFDEAIILLYYWVNKDDMEETFQKRADIPELMLKDDAERYELLHSIYMDVKEHFAFRKERIEYLFKAHNTDFSTYATLSILWEYHNFDNRLLSYKERFHSMKEEERVRLFARLIDCEEFASISKEKLSTFADLIAFLDTSSYDKEAKWEAIKIYNNQEAYYNEVVDLLAEVIEHLNTHHAVALARLEKLFYDYWSEYQKKRDIVETLKERLSFSWEDGDAGAVIVPNLFQPFSLSLSIDEEDPSRLEVIRIGIMMNQNFILTGKRIRKEDMINIGKLLSDKSKVDILEYAGKKPCYGKELANELQLSTATISYHVNALLKEGLLKAEVSANKVYYSLNREALASYFEDVKNYFLK